MLKKDQLDAVQDQLLQEEDKALIAQKEVDIEQIKNELKLGGLRLTVSRIAVYTLLKKAEKPLSYTDVLHLLGHENWDKATLYRNLIDLCEAGLIQEVDVGGKMLRYEMKEKRSAHHSHFVCTSCGDIQCLPTLALGQQEALPKALKTGEVDIQIRAHCDDCLDE